MQEDESMEIWYGISTLEVYREIRVQKKSYQLSGVINPFAAVQSLSMVLRY